MLTFSRRAVYILWWILALAIPLVGWSTYYFNKNPPVFNESIWGHAHCIVDAGVALSEYARDHGGKYPSHPDGYGDALLSVNSMAFASFSGPGYPIDALVRERARGGDVVEEELGRVYVQGLTTDGDYKIALLFDKLPTPGGDHCHLWLRFFAPLGREVLLRDGSKRFIPKSEWPAFAATQIELLLKEGVPRKEAEAYYAAETPAD